MTGRRVIWWGQWWGSGIQHQAELFDGVTQWSSTHAQQLPLLISSPSVLLQACNPSTIAPVDFAAPVCIGTTSVHLVGLSLEITLGAAHTSRSFLLFISHLFCRFVGFAVFIWIQLRRLQFVVEWHIRSLDRRLWTSFEGINNVFIGLSSHV